LTVQNTLGVTDIHSVPAAFVGAQIDAVVTDIGVDAAKTGMLANADIVRVVARTVRQHQIDRLVVDPVLLAQGGAALLAADARDTLRRELLPLALLVTPNIPEAEMLADLTIRSVADMRTAAKSILDLGARACLVKGGHLHGGDAIDVFDDGTGPRELVAARLQTRHTHGTGCQLSAAITANLALGKPLLESVETAKRFITVAIRHGLAIGHGSGPANALAWPLKGR
jgi:hydroxymethylpyrimidine/phosphomethylpyrimidine kinase